MKSLNIKFPFTINDLLNFFDQLDTKDLQLLADKISRLISNRNKQNPEDKESQLLAIIKNALPQPFLIRFKELQSKMETATLTASERLEMEAYVEKIEEFDTEKMNALHELSKLRKVSFQQLAKDLNVFPSTNG